MMHHRSQQGYLEYYFTDFDLWETKPSQNSERIMRTYEVLADHHVKLGWFRSRIEERTILVQAESADEAKSIVAGDRVGFGLSDFGFVRAARPHKAD